MTEHLFVYGTLCPGKPNEHIMENIGGTWHKAIVEGELRAGGWGAEMGFPGIVLNVPEDKREAIHGYVFSSENLATNWQMLDEFEGVEYQRILTDVQLENGQLMQAYVYALASE